MIVMKFGGSSVRDAEAVDRVSRIVSGRIEERPVVVVSAMGATTDDLVEILDAMETGNIETATSLAEHIGEHHRAVIGQVLADNTHRQAALDAAETHLNSLDRYIDGMNILGEVSPRSRDAVLALGELMSSTLLASFMSARGLPAALVDPTDLIVTSGDHCEALPEVPSTNEASRRVLSPLLDAGALPVTGGFVGRTAGGTTTTLGRGGSDLTASLLASALEATRIEYWKDVDGILTADPEMVNGARPVSRLSFREAAELAFLGAGVLHPMSIQPAATAGIPVRVQNSHRPEAPGTEVCVHGRTSTCREPTESAASAITCKRDQILVNVHSNRMLGASGFLRRVFEVFDRLAISVDHISTSEVNVTITMAPSQNLSRLETELAEVATTSITPGTGVVSVVGERLTDTPGAARRIFDALDDVNISLITYGGSGVNLSMAIRDREVPSAVCRLHRELFEDIDRGATREGATR